MNWKSTGILVVTATVLFAFIWLVDRPIRQQRLRQASRIILPGFDPAAVSGVEVKPRSAIDIRVERSKETNDLWQMSQPIKYPAQEEPILRLLDALAGLEWEQRISASELKDEPDAQEKYGFTQPQFELSVEESGASREILIGQSSAMGDQVFLEVVGNPDIYLVGADLLTLIPSDKDHWRDLSLFDLARLPYQSIQVRSPGRGFDLERDPTNNLWLMKQPVTARADSARIKAWLQGLQKLRVRQFVSDDPKADLELYGLQTSPQTPDLDLSFWAATNSTAELQIGASPTNLTNMAFARWLNPGNVVLIDRDALQPWLGAYTNFLDYHFISGSPDLIASITVNSRGEEPFTVQKKTDSQWEVRSGTTFPADANLMNQWLASFTNIETHIEKTVATDFAEYGLKAPLLQYTLEATGASNAVMAQINFGTNQSGQVFERRPDESFVNLITPGDFDWLPRAAWQLRDRRIWTFDSSNVVSLTVHQLGGTRKYLRDPAGEWTFAPGYHGPPWVNWLSLEEGVHRLGQLSAVYWSGAGDAHAKDFGFDKADFSLSLEVKSGGAIETNAIEFGGRSSYSYPYAAVEQNGRRYIFEFPVELYENFVEHDMTLPPTLRRH